MANRTYDELSIASQDTINHSASWNLPLISWRYISKKDSLLAVLQLGFKRFIWQHRRSACLSLGFNPFLRMTFGEFASRLKSKRSSYSYTIHWGLVKNGSKILFGGVGEALKEIPEKRSVGEEIWLPFIRWKTLIHTNWLLQTPPLIKEQIHVSMYSKTHERLSFSWIDSGSFIHPFFFLVRVGIFDSEQFNLCPANGQKRD
jgi:hypothetical protein